MVLLNKMDYSINKLDIGELKNVLQDCNINFLIGAGLSSPYLALLGDVEGQLRKMSEKLEQEDISEDKEIILRSMLYKNFFEKAICGNIGILSDNNDGNEVLNNYKEFLRIINTILLKRRSTILNKQVNIFTTNFDIFLEKALERLGLEYNDGFSGRFRPQFDLSNFKKSVFKRTLHYDNTYELPTFNLIKLHGSVTWKREGGKIIFDKELDLLKEVAKSEAYSNIKSVDTVKCLDCLISKVDREKADIEISKKFISEYDNISIVNPTKEKFKETILNKNYYELLRIYSTELEKENTVLFVMGFSFSDEHIREVTIRVANSNPTLKIYIFAYDDKAKDNIENELRKSEQSNKNIIVIPPEESTEESAKEDTEESTNFDFKNINEKIYGTILKQIE